MLWPSKDHEFCQNCSRFRTTNHSSPSEVVFFSLKNSLLQVSRWPGILSLFSLFSVVLTFCRGGIIDANNLFPQILILSTAYLGTDIPAALFLKGWKCESYGWKCNLHVRLRMGVLLFVVYCLVGV